MNSANTLCESCPGADAVRAFVSGELDFAVRQPVAAHLAACASCAKLAGHMLPGDNSFDAPTSVTRRPYGTPHPADPVAVGDHTVASPPAARPAFLGPYRIGERIGQGGMGTVYRSEHTRLKKWVAVKILPAAQGANPHAVGRFEREMEVVGRLDHPNIVRATDAGDSDGRHYLVMDLIEGVDLARLVATTGPLGIPEACEIVRQAAHGLQHAYEHGLVHRDLKPHNLMLNTAGEVKVLDLGLATFRSAEPPADGLTWDGQVMGTPAFMAPEQWQNPHGVDTRADVYGLGCTLYFLLTGRPPVDSTDRDVLLRETCPSLAHVRPELPHAPAVTVDDLLTRVLAKDPAHRPQTPAELADQLAPLAADSDLTAVREASFRLASHAHVNTPLPSPIATRKQTTREPLPRQSRSRPRAFLVLTGTLSLAVLVAWGTGLLRPSAADAQGPPAVPQAGRWFNLLDKADRPPTAFLRENADRGSGKDFDAGLQRFQLNAVRRGAWTLHRVDSPNYTFRVSMRQLPWTGGVGIFLGGQKDAEAGVQTYYTVSLRPSHEGIRQAIIHRAQHTHYLDKDPPFNNFEKGMLKDASIGALTPRDYTLEVRVVENRLVSVWWNGVALDCLRDLPGGPPPLRGYAGDIGLFAHDASVTFVSAELLLTD